MREHTKDRQTLRAWLAMVHAPGLGPSTGARLLEQTGSPEAVLAAGRSAWREAGASEAACQALDKPDWATIDANLGWLDHSGRRLIILDGSDYPARLRQISRPPLALFVVGDAELLHLPQIAMVGSRNPTRGGREHAREFAAYLADAGFVITSGLALGIDGEAHGAALAAQGATAAVAGTGLDRVYPARHRELARRIAETGVLVSEFPPGTQALPTHFPQRNRVISGLSLGVLVVEAAQRSGSLITARLAMEQGREVFALPGSIHNPLARGCHALIRQGAKLVETADDILEELGPLLGASRAPEDTQAASPASTPGLDPEYAELLQAMGYEPVNIDTLVQHLGLTPETVSSMLLQLELRGLVETAPSGAYVQTLSRQAK
jgi:DNA processing protein